VRSPSRKAEENQLGRILRTHSINLIEANHVIHYTRPWNPAKENQATDRVHRRGQQKPVTIYYPTVVGTVEDKLAQLLADKLELARDVLRPTRERTVSVEDLVDDLDLDPAVETS
jgi:SNF2 family DNA or RNA helicase